MNFSASDQDLDQTGADHNLTKKPSASKHIRLAADVCMLCMHIPYNQAPHWSVSVQKQASVKVRQ